MTKESLISRRSLLIGLSIAVAGSAGVALGVRAESPPLTPRKRLPIIMANKQIPYSSDTRIEVYLNNNPFYPLYYGTKSGLFKIATGFSFDSDSFVDFPGSVYGLYKSLAFRFREGSGIRYEVISENHTHEQTYSTQLTIPVEEDLPKDYFIGSVELYGVQYFKLLIVQNLIEIRDDGARLIAWGTQPGDGIFRRLAGGGVYQVSLNKEPVRAFLYREHKVVTTKF